MEKNIIKKIINLLTLSRILLGFLFGYIIYFRENILLVSIIVYIITILTDIFDGKIARSFNLTSSQGAIFDVMADFSFIIITCSFLALKNLLPYWILIIITLKLIEFFITSIKSDKKEVLIFENFGKAVSLMFYSLPLITIILYYILPLAIFSNLILKICIILTILAIISSLSRIKENLF